MTEFFETITRSPLCWPDNVPRTHPANLGCPRFDERSIPFARDLLLCEINRLNRRQWDYRDARIIISSNMRVTREGIIDSRQVEPNDPGVAIYFLLRFFRNGKQFERPTVLTCDRWCKVAYNLTAIGKDIEAQRARDRWGCTSIEQAFRGYFAIPERCGGPAWWETLGIGANAGQTEIEAAYKRLAKSRHPDSGGSAEAFAKLREAYEQATARFK